MQSLIIYSDNREEIKRYENREEFMEILGNDLGCVDKSYISSTHWIEKKRKKIREQCATMAREGKGRKEISDFMEREAKGFNYQKRGYKEDFVIARLPFSLTGGKHISIAWRNKGILKFVNEKTICSPGSYLISICLHQSNKGKRERKDGKEGDVVFVGYYGTFILFDDWNFSSSLSKDNNKDNSKIFTITKGRRTHIDHTTYRNLLHTANEIFQRQLRDQQERENLKRIGRKDLLQWIASPYIQEKVEEDYQETLKRFLIPIADQKDKYEIVLNNILKWQEEDKEGVKRCHPLDRYPFSSSLSSSSKEKEKEGKEKEEFIVNPLTNRKLKAGSKIHLKLIEEKIL